jgi:hypothetical protein
MLFTGRRQATAPVHPPQCVNTLLPLRVWAVTPCSEVSSRPVCGAGTCRRAVQADRHTPHAGREDCFQGKPRALIALHKAKYVVPISIEVHRVSGLAQDSTFMGVFTVSPPPGPLCCSVWAAGAMHGSKLLQPAPGMGCAAAGCARMSGQHSSSHRLEGSRPRHLLVIPHFAWGHILCSRSPSFHRASVSQSWALVLAPLLLLHPNVAAPSRTSCPACAHPSGTSAQ